MIPSEMVSAGEDGADSMTAVEVTFTGARDGEISIGFWTRELRRIFVVVDIRNIRMLDDLNFYIIFVVVVHRHGRGRWIILLKLENISLCAKVFFY